MPRRLQTSATRCHTTRHSLSTKLLLARSLRSHGCIGALAFHTHLSILDASFSRCQHSRSGQTCQRTCAQLRQELCKHCTQEAANGKQDERACMRMYQAAAQQLPHQVRVPTLRSPSQCGTNSPLSDVMRHQLSALRPAVTRERIRTRLA